MRNIGIKRNNLLLLSMLLFIVKINAQTIINNPSSSNVDIDELNITSINSYAGSVASGKYSVWYGCNHTQIEKPFIYVEGIDLTPGNTERSNFPILQNGASFLQDLMVDGYDIIQLDFSQNPQYIQRNAELLITLINDINAKLKANGSLHEIVVMGESMGAIVARYALTKMEYDNANEGGPPHNVRLYLSLDGPHQGANVPWGLQYMAQDLANKPTSLAAITTIVGGYNLLNFMSGAFLNLVTNGGSGGLGGVEAGFQLLRDSPILLADAYAFSFRNNLNNIGNYPSKCRKVALSNGDNDGNILNDQDENGIGNIDDVNEGSTLLRLVLPPPFNVSYNVFAAPGIISGIPNLVYSRVPVNILNSKFRFYLPVLKNWDVSPGGTYFNDRDYVAFKQHRFTFIPLVSGLDLNTNDPYYSIKNNISGFNTTKVPDFNYVNNEKTMLNVGYTHSSGKSEFDAIWADDDNTYHVGGEGFQFLKQEISPSTLVVQDRIIDKNTSFEASKYVLVGKDLSPAFPVGDVIFENGSEAEVWSGKEVWLKDGIWAKQGSEVHFFIDSYNCQ